MKIGIMMHDYKLEYEVGKKLKSMNKKYEIIENKKDIEDYEIVITDYFKDTKNCIICSDPEECIRKSKSYFYGKKRFRKLIVGIDPGPKPGIAVIGDGNVVEELQVPYIKNIRKIIDEIYQGYSPEILIIRIGDGDITNRNRIINSLIDTYIIEMVNERNTSESMTNKDIESAKAIAHTRGERIKNRQNLVVTDGYLKDIQRKSRIESNGLVTISRSLARKVALGELTLKKAIELTKNKNKKN